jgi:glycosyltransferase involved in cell wall biosynthesis
MSWRRNIAVIPNIAPFEPPAGTLNSPASLRVVTVASDSRLKNVRSALNAWPIVLQSFPDAELHLVGEGLGPSEDLARWAEPRGLQRQVSWHGHLDRDEVRKVIGTAQALLHPSLEESLGNCLLEAMALGVPVVGGKGSGAVPWTVGKGGTMTDVRSPSAVAATVVDLLRDPDRCRRLGEAGRRRVADVFSPESVSVAWEEQYSTMLGGIL